MIRITIRRSILWAAWAAAGLAAAGCGGGSGDPGAGTTSFTVDALFDGMLGSDATIQSNSTNGIMVGDDGARLLDGYVRVIHSTELLAAAGHIVSVHLVMTKVATVGASFPDYGPIHVNHVDFGIDGISGADFASPVLPDNDPLADIASWSNALVVEVKPVDVTAQVVGDLTAARGYSDFYLYASGLRTAGKAVLFESLDHLPATGTPASGPYLAVVRTP